MVKKITVIGGSGFIGTNLCKKLSLKQQDFEIIDLKKSKSFPDKCKVADVRSIDSLRSSITGDVIINLAAVHRDDVRDAKEYKKTNIGGAQNIVQVCNEKKINKIVFTSSVAVYGFAEIGTGEDGKIEPFNEYGKTKYEAEKKFISWYNQGERSLIIVRPTVVFGDGNRGNVFNLFNQIASNRFIMVGDGLNKKSMAYVENVVAFLEACIFSEERYGLFNYVDTPNLTMNELVGLVRRKIKGKNNVGFRLPYSIGLVIGILADLISNITGRRLSVSSIRVKKFVSSSEFVSSKSDLDNFAPPFGLVEGIEKTIQSEFIIPDPSKEIFFTE